MGKTIPADLIGRLQVQVLYGPPLTQASLPCGPLELRHSSAFKIIKMSILKNFQTYIIDVY